MVASMDLQGYRHLQPIVAESGSRMEHGSIERELHVDASPEVVFTVISRPEHIREWWSDEAALEPGAGSEGVPSWRDATGRTDSVAITVTESDPPRRFAFRWVYATGETPAVDNSLLVTFDLEPHGDGTIVHFQETGFRERGWEAAVLEQQYAEHATGWDTFLPRIAGAVERAGASR